MKKIKSTFIKIINRLLGLTLVISLCFLTIIPYTVYFLIFGIDKANSVMNYIMEIPMNLVFSDNY